MLPSGDTFCIKYVYCIVTKILLPSRLVCLLLKIYQFYVFVLFFAAAVVFYITYKLLINYSLHTILCAKNTVIYVRKFS